MGAQQSWSPQQFIAWCAAAPGRLAGVSWRKPLQQCGLVLKRAVADNFTGSHDPDGTPWEPLHFPRIRTGTTDRPLRDTGQLLASVTGRGPGAVYELGDTQLVIGSNLPQAGIHQDGGTIVPKNAKALAIPLTQEAARVRGPREFPSGLFVWRPAGGDKAYLAEVIQTGPRGGRGGRQPRKGNVRDVSLREGGRELRLHYILLRSVTIPARPFLGASAAVVERMGQIFRDYVRSLFGGSP